MIQKTTFLTILIFCTIFTTTSAKKWRVNNSLIAPTQVDFEELKDAVESASVVSGDTIYVEGSATHYEGGIEIFKQLTIIGPGHLLDQANLQPSVCNQLPASIAGTLGIALKQGAEGSYITGLNFDSGFASPTSISLENTSNIIITRNRLEEINFVGPSSGATSSTSNISITRNIIKLDIGFSCPISVNTILIANNLILGHIHNNCASINTILIENGTVKNNTMRDNSDIWIKGSEVSYNYTGKIESEPDNISIHHNILHEDNSDNQNIVATNSTNEINPFDDSSFSYDSDNWTLLPPDQTTTHGAYNGFDPYYSDNPISPANLPAIPVMYNCTVQPCGDQTIQIEIDVRTNN